MSSKARKSRSLRLVNGSDGEAVTLAGGVVVAEDAGERTVDLGGARLTGGLVNCDEHLELSTLPPLGTPPYANGYAWAEALAAGPALSDALRIAEPDRLWLGGLRNLLAGATSILQHGPYHRSLGRPDFPVRVQDRYGFAVSPEATPVLRRAYRSSDRRIPWLIHAGEGTDARVQGEVGRLAEANVLRHNTVLVHGIALGPEDAARLAEAEACVVWCPEADLRRYAASADVAMLIGAGVRVALGTDSAAAGARDPLSNLAQARATGAVDDGALLEMATAGSAAVARMPSGDVTVDATADLVAWSGDPLQGDRRAVLLVVIAGEAVYGREDLMAAAGVPSSPVVVDGERRALPRDAARRLRSLLKSGAARAGAAWLQGVEVPA